MRGSASVVLSPPEREAVHSEARAGLEDNEYHRSISIARENWGETMARYMELVLEKRQVRGVALLLDDKAPKTCDAVWNALPQEGPVFHAKSANNEIYILVEPFATNEPGPEHRTIGPASGDVLYFYFPWGAPPPPKVSHLKHPLVDLAVFYDRNNLLFSLYEGALPGNAFATIVRNLEGMRDAGNSIWYEGAVDERLIFRRLEPG